MEQINDLATLIDMPFEQFKEYVQTLNVGMINNLILLLNQVYSDLCSRKDAVLKSHNYATTIEECIKKLYAELIKIEEKSLYLNKYLKDLTPEVFDTEN